jgi:hypothetical protein
MVKIEVEIWAIVGVFSMDFGDQCSLFPDDQNIQKRTYTA